MGIYKNNLKKIKRALISLSDKSDLNKLLLTLLKFKIEIISSGGTYKEIKKLKFSCIEVSEFTGFPEILDGRVKTLHPKIHGGILAKRDNVSHNQDLANNQIEFIDLVVTNLYPFYSVATNQASTEDQIIENIDIGGPTLLRAAAKNFNDVIVLVDPMDYSMFHNMGRITPACYFHH
jgi:phosphoribosylaminoimidazolecarboxamide formyltransferase/IMP cyclohydrolase